MLKILRKKDTYPQRLVYTHLAKAGGNSINAFLNNLSGEYALSTLGISGASSVNADAERLKGMITKHGLLKEDFKIILGHLPFSASRKLFPSSIFTTVMREPEWQLVSSYCSQPFNTDKLDFGISNFIDMVEGNPYAEWAIDNYQTRMLCDDPRFGTASNVSMLESAKRNLKEHYLLVGFTEHIEDYFQSLAAIYGSSSVQPAITPRNVTGNYKPCVEPHHLEYARQRNALDVSLYQWAIKEFLSRPSLPPIVSPAEKGSTYINVWINCK